MADQPMTDEQVWGALLRFQRTTLAAMDANLRERFGRTLDDYDVLHQLVVAGQPTRMGDLAASLLVANSSCNRIVGRLVEAGLVQRSSGAEDRREVLVSLTSEGRRLHRRMAAVHTRDIRRWFGDRLHRDEVAVIGGAMARLVQQSAGG